MVAFETGMWLTRMREPAEPLRVPRREPLVDALLDEHVAAAATDPELYALVAVARGAVAAQQSRALFALLAGSRSAMDDRVRALLDRVVGVLLARLSADDVLAVCFALRKRRENHKHLSRALARWVLRHPDETLFVRRRRALLETLEHALGRDVVRACAKHVAVRTPEGDRYLARTIGRVAGGDPLVDARLAMLAATHPSRTAIVRGDEAPHADLEAFQPPKTVTATNRGDVAATLVHLYRGGESELLRRGLAEYVDQAAARLPAFEANVALVVDASLSTRGYGEREFCCISQSWALRLVLGRRCAGLAVYLAGGHGEDPPQPAGATDLATPVLDAIAAGADVVAVVTDGYENRVEGELAAVIAALPGAGIATPVVIVNSKFTHKDDLALRRPAPTAITVDMWHEHDFQAVVETIGCALRGDAGRRFVQQTLGDRLRFLEGAYPSWTRTSPRELA